MCNKFEITLVAKSHDMQQTEEGAEAELHQSHLILQSSIWSMSWGEDKKFRGKLPKDGFNCFSVLRALRKNSLSYLYLLICELHTNSQMCTEILLLDISMELQE